MDQTPPKSRIRWLCRRGMKELDVLLERFFAAEYDNFSAAERDTFYRILQLEDPDLYAYLMGRAAPESTDIAAMITRIREYRHEQANPAGA